jgi:CRP/FNR family transcriptional regulator, cyclic AMP receptor protein
MLGGSLFKDLPEPELRRLVAIARRRRFARGEVVFHDGDPADALHLVIRGYFAARLETRRGDAVTMSVHGPGDSFGELALLETEQARSTTVTARAAGETYAVRRDDFSRLRRDYPEVNEVLTRLLAQRLRRTTELLTEALFVSADLRVLRRLAELATLYAPGARTAVVPLAQHELAELAGTSRATVNRVLRTEVQRGTVTLGRNQITVIDPKTIAARAARGDLS